MGKQDNNPFRSGNTAAIDLDQVDKDAEDGWNPWNQRRNQEKNPWASDDWGGGGGGKDWPDEFGGKGGAKGGTAALDISEFEGGEGEPPPASRRANKKGNDWGDIEDFFGGGGGGGGGTAALDLGGFQGDDEESEPERVQRKKRAERTEDVRDPHTHNDQRGRLSYEGGQGDPTRERGETSRGKGRNQAPTRRPKEAVEESALEGDEDESLMPHERTMAIGLDEIKGMQPPPPPGGGMRRASGSAPRESMARTEALDVEALRQGARPVPADLFPDESTVGISLSGGEAPTTDFARPDEARGNPSRTSMLDKAELERYRLNEAASGAKLLIFVPGNAPVPFDLRPGITNVGRERTNHLVLSDPYCSRKHLRFKKMQATFEARDTGSDNGTLLNGAPMTPNQDVPLQLGDELRIGSTTMRFLRGEPRPEDYAPPRFERSVTSSRPAVPQYTDQVMDPGGRNTGRIEAPMAPATQGGGVPAAAIVVVMALIIGIVLLAVVALVYFFYAKSGGGGAAALWQGAWQALA
jgi:hypothetical protein